MAAGILFGQRPQISDTSLAVSEDGLPLVFSYELSWQKMRRCIVPAAVAASSSESIWLFSRRVKRRADTFYDHLILQLTIYGLVTNLLTMTCEIWQMCTPDLRLVPWRKRWLYVLRPYSLEENDSLQYSCTLITSLIISGVGFGLAHLLGLKDFYWSDIIYQFAPSHTFFFGSLTIAAVLSGLVSSPTSSKTSRASTNM